jgi:uncharacterized membrane protein (UPF0127 family)
MRTMTKLRRLGLLLITMACVQPAPAQQSLPTTELTINGHRVTAEVATTVATRAVGLMRRFSLRPDHGMLFVFDAPQPLMFWMKDTYIPLSIAFIGADGRILNIEDMAPQTESPHDSRGPAMFALEMKKGWFAQFAIAPGDRVVGLEHAPKASE